MEVWVKLNTDGSYQDNEKVKLRDHEGCWLSGFLGSTKGGNVFISEARALKEGLFLAWSLGFKKVLCEVDSADLIEALEEDEAIRFAVEVKDILNCMAKDWLVKLSRIPRDSNFAADCMAKSAAKVLGPGLRVIGHPSVELETLIMRNKLRAL